METSTSETTVVLVADDEDTLREAIVYNLKREGWTIAQAADGHDALAQARALKPDLLVLDVMMPGMDGLQVCRALRAESNVPILFLSARGEEVDRILGLEMGGDDYLSKPFAMRELVARVRAMLRRAQMATTSSVSNATPNRAVDPVPQHVDRPLVSGDLKVDVARRTAVRGGKSIVLKPKEFDLLVYLMRYPGIVLSREALLRQVWGYDYPVDTRTVDVHVRWLRLKLEVDPSNPRWIETVRGYGYRFAAAPT
jgi:DNA-binding response OmpR family regulator